MATKFYFGEKPLLSQPSIGGSKMGRAFIGGTRVYGEIPWTPESMNGITHWWRADLGVTLSSGTVTQWTDQISGKNLTQEGSSTAPDYVSSDSTMNNQPAIEFGNDGTTTDALSDEANKVTIGASDFPFMWWVFSTADNARGGYQGLGGDARNSSGQELFVEFNHPSYANTISVYTYAMDSFGGATQGDLTSRPDKGWVAFAVDNNDSNHPGYLYKNSRSRITAYTIGSNYWGQVGGGLQMVVGNYGSSQTLGYVGRLLEFGFGTEEMDADSETNFHAYLNTRYGLSL